MLCASTASACPVLVLLLDDIVDCGIRDFLFLLFVLFFDALALARGAGLAVANPIAVAVALVLVKASSAGFVRDLVLRAGAVGLTVSLAAACRRRRFLIAFADGIGVIAGWCVDGCCTLRPAFVRTLGTGYVRSVSGGVLYRLSRLMASCTLGAAGVFSVLGWVDEETCYKYSGSAK